MEHFSWYLKWIVNDEICISKKVKQVIEGVLVWMKVDCLDRKIIS